MKFPQLHASPEDFMNPRTGQGVVFRHFSDSKYSAAMVVISSMIDVERERIEKYQEK